MEQFGVSSTAACDPLQTGRSPSNVGLHLDFGVLQWSKMVEARRTQNEAKHNP